MAKAAAKTGTGPAALVAIEQFYPENIRILSDPFQYRLLPGVLKFMVSMVRPKFMLNWMVDMAAKSAPGLWGGLLCRKRYIDEKLSESAGKIQQIVNLVAGLDTRLFRLPEVAGIPAWELDQPDNIAYKRRAISKLPVKPPESVKLIPIDFDTQSLRETLRAAGYLPSVPTFFIWEAVTQYLTLAGIQTVCKNRSLALWHGTRGLAGLFGRVWLEGY